MITAFVMLWGILLLVAVVALLDWLGDRQDRASRRGR